MTKMAPKKQKIQGCAKIRGAKIKGAKIKGARKLKGVRVIMVFGK